MEDDATRTPSPRSKSARPPAALFMEPKVPSPNGAHPETAIDPEAAPGPPAAPAPEPEAPTVPAPRQAAPRTATPAEAARAKATSAKATEAAPGNATKASPAKATKAAPAKATKASPVKATKTSPAKATKAASATAAKTTTAKTTTAKTTAAKTATAKTATAKTATAKTTAAKTGPAKTTKAAPTKASRTAPAQAAPRKAVPTEAVPKPVPGRQPWWTRTPTRTSAVPAYLAEAAVERYGDSALRYVDWLRATYPDATPDGLARVVLHGFGRRVGYTALAGPAGPVALVAAQARLVLYLAAAYGRDPRDPERVPELLRLVTTRPGPVLARLAGRILPGAGLVAGVLTDAGALERTARRALAYYTVTD